MTSHHTVPSNCCFCSSSECSSYYQENEWKVVRCSNCGLCYTNPRPTVESLPFFYSEEYYKEIFFKKSKNPNGYYNSDGSIRESIQDYTPRINSIENFCKIRTSLLELGAARGAFLKVMSDRGWEVDGVEISSDAVAVGKKMYNVNLFNGVLEDFKTDKKYDVVCMYQTLEHVYNPAFVIKRSHELLNKDGLLVIEVPNINSADMWFNKERKQLTYDLPRHLTHFTPKTLSKHLIASGYKIEHIDIAYPEFLNYLLSFLPKKTFKNSSPNANQNVNIHVQAITPMAKLYSSKKSELLNFISSIFPGWRFTIVARKQ